MPCHVMKLPGGGVAIIKCAKTRAKRCACGAASSLLCDWKMGGERTCDRPMCPACAHEVGPDKHLCGAHHAAWKQHPLFRP